MSSAEFVDPDRLEFKDLTEYTDAVRSVNAIPAGDECEDSDIDGMCKAVGC